MIGCSGAHEHFSIIQLSELPMRSSFTFTPYETGLRERFLTEGQITQATAFS